MASRYPPQDDKQENERPLEEMEYESQLQWKFMKRLRSETRVRHWHIKVHLGKMNEKGKPVFEDYNLHQTFVGKIGERLSAFKATRSGRAADLSKPLFTKPGEDWLHGIEYLLRTLEGQDISELNLSKRK